MEIREEKVKQAIKEISNIFNELELNIEEVEHVVRSGYIAARCVIKENEIEKEADKYVKRMETTKESTVQWLPTIVMIIGIILEIIMLVIIMK